MKVLFSSLLMALAVSVIAAPVNKVSEKWNAYAKKGDATATAKIADGIINLSNTAPTQNGYNQTIILNQTTPKAISFGGESKAEEVTGAASSNYCIYLDIQFTGGKPVWGQMVVFSTGTHDWEKKERTLKFDHPIKSINYYVLFRNMKGKAEFRNLFLNEL